MVRLWLVATLSALLATSSVAQEAWNPNSPRARRDAVANPPQPSAAPPWFETIEPERWGTVGKPWPEPQWGTIGKCGWVGVTETSTACYGWRQ
jgi:hypothetical protein